MPTVLRWNGYRFYFFSNERDEPPHIHVDKGDASVKFWLAPVMLERNYGFPSHELHRIRDKVSECEMEFMRAWHEYFDN
jgi:Domain of unknown function (DUF4160)